MIGSVAIIVTLQIKVSARIQGAKKKPAKSVIRDEIINIKLYIFTMVDKA